MNPSFRLPASLAGLLATFLGLATSTPACSSDYHTVMEGCAYTSGCPLGKFCNRLSAVCEDEPVDRLVGSFSCEFTSTSNSSSGNVGSTDVLGTFTGERMVLNILAMCSYSAAVPGGATITVQGLTSSGTQQALQVVLPAPHNGEFNVVSPEEFNQLPTTDESGFANLAVKPAGLDQYQTIGHSAKGYVSLDNTPSVGAMLSGYIDITLTAP